MTGLAKYIITKSKNMLLILLFFFILPKIIQKIFFSEDFGYAMLFWMYYFVFLGVIFVIYMIYVKIKKPVSKTSLETQKLASDSLIIFFLTFIGFIAISLFAVLILSG